LLISSPYTAAVVKFHDAIVLSGWKEPTAALTTDLNSDGKPDLIVLDGRTSTVNVLLNQGGANFSRTAYRVSRRPVTSKVADFNHDGISDIVVTNGEGVSILLGRPNGEFAPAKTYTATPPNQSLNPLPTGLGVGDFNGDGFLDLIVTDSLNNTVNFLAGN